MTDARFPERWLNDRRIMRLPDDAFRLFVVSLTWSVANRTDGRIYDDELALLPASPAGSGNLAKAGLWERVADYWLITVFEETQTTQLDLEHLDAQRRTARDRKRKERARRAGRAVPRDVTADSTRTGQARTGVQQEPPTSVHTRERETCLGCELPPRHGCSTCWDHAYLEASAGCTW